MPNLGRINAFTAIGRTVSGSRLITRALFIAGSGLALSCLLLANGSPLSGWLSSNDYEKNLR